MSRVLYFDCFSGISGDMALGALLDAGSAARRPEGARSAASRSATLMSTPRRCCAPACRRRSSASTNMPEATLRTRTIPRSRAPRPWIRAARGASSSPSAGDLQADRQLGAVGAGPRRAKAMFQRLGEAEAAIHQMPVEKVHLHEVGALDSIIDIVGIVFAHGVGRRRPGRLLAAERRRRDGRSRRTGVFPVPAPATVSAAGRRAGLQRRGAEGARHADRRADCDDVRLVVRSDSGDVDRARGLRRRRARRSGDAERAARPDRPRRRSARRPNASRVIECEIDDMNPQIFGVVMDRLYAAGALEVFYVPVQMKKNRPGTLLTVVAPPEQRRAMTDVIFRETTTIGLRHYEVDRECLRARDRDGGDAARAGAVQGRARADGRVINASPEFEDCARLAAAHNLPVKEVQALRRCKAYQAVSRFFLTTAIDYVNSRPHLGTAYEKVCADVIARYKRLCGFDTRFLMGNDEHSQNVFKKARGRGARSAGVLRPDGAGVPADVAAARRLVRRFHPDDRAAPPGGRHRPRHAASTTPATSTKASTRAGTASAARSSSRRRTSSTATARCTRR